jgi:hypothetical protein
MSKFSVDWKKVAKYPMVEGNPTMPGRYWLWTHWVGWEEVRISEGPNPVVTSPEWPPGSRASLTEIADHAVWRGPIVD